MTVLSPAKHRRDRRRRIQRTTAILSLLAVLILGVLAWDTTRLTVTEYEARVADLPTDLDGTTVVQVSDLHAATFGEDNANLLAAVAAADPDLIAITGDLVSSTTVDLDPMLRTADDLADIATTAYVSGNHEADNPLRADLEQGLAARGVHVLHGTSLDLEHGGSTVRVLGIADPRSGASMAAMLGLDYEAVLRMRIGALEPGDADATVLLSHRPYPPGPYRDAEVDLVLAGHAHGGQVRLPLIGGLISPNEGLLPRYTDGVHDLGGTQLVVSRGLGNTPVAPLRVNNPPELVVVTLRPA